MSVKTVLNQLFFAAFWFALVSGFNLTINAQNNKEPELNVAGIRLGDRASAKKFLGSYSAGMGDQGQPEYTFWNKFGDQVMKVSAISFDDPFFITRIEVFYAPQSYMGRHYVLKDQGYFVTENGIFIGYRQSAVALLAGIPNVGRNDRIGPNDIERKKGAPTSKTKEDKKETLIYDLGKINLDIDGKTESVNYTARYVTNKNKLRRFIFEISSERWKKPE